MLAAYFNIPAAASEEDKCFGKKKKAPAAAPKKRAAARKPPKPTEAATATATEHAKFEPLPAEKRVPRPAEEPGQAWQAFDGVTTAKEDDIAEFRADWEWEEEELTEDDEMSEPDFEPESLDPLSVETSVVEGSLGSVDDDIHCFLGKRHRRQTVTQPTTLYSGPQLRYEEEDFD